jgi:hypothetical protein
VILGAGPGRYPATDTDLPPGGVLALYTDGLVERPGQDLGTGMSRLARALAATPAPSLDELCDSVLASLAPHSRDDITLLLARTTAQTAANSASVMGSGHGGHPASGPTMTCPPDTRTRNRARPRSCTSPSLPM